MIITEMGDYYYFFEQHEHGEISGALCERWDNEYFLGEDLRGSVEFAIKNHDRCWKRLDSEPIYLIEDDKPASFIHYPLEKKIAAYTSGVDEMEKKDKYAAYLISLHYSSFFRGNVVEIGKVFREKEYK